MKTLLVVDDLPEDREMLVRVFEADPETEYEVLEASDAASCFDELESHKNIDCLLLDYSMPGQDGLELLSNLLDQYPVIPILMVTGHGNEGIAVDAIKLGAQDYIVKNSFTPTDIRRRVIMALEHKEMERQLAQQQQSLRDFADILVHDLRAPLRSIKGPIDMLTRGDGHVPEETQARLFDFITDSVEQMDRLILSLQQFVRPQRFQPNFEMFCPTRLIEHVKGALAYDIEATGTTLTFHRDCQSIWGSPQLLGQLLQNLVENAIKFRRGSKSKVRIEVNDAGDSWKLEVVDDGSGIASEHLIDIFEPFKRLHAGTRSRGAGLGLATCKRIVEQHGATITCESALGQGSKFTVSLPKPKSV